MIELTISKRSTKLFRHSLDDGTITIGRNPDSEIYLNSPSVSHEHARISLSEGKWFIEDLASKGGTLVNDITIQHSELHDKDVIQVGHYKIDCSFVMDKQTSNVASIHPVKTEQPQDKTDSEASEETQYPEEVVPKIMATESDIDKPFGSTDSEQQTELRANENASFPNSGEDPNPQRATENDIQPEAGKPAIDNSSFSAGIQPHTSTRGGAVPPLHGTGVDVLAGPAQGKRIYFTRDSAALGVKDVTAVVIKSVEDGYTAQAPNEALPVTLNDDAIDDNPVQLDNGDLIGFSNLSARFFVDTSVE